jgi:hypothetical protein
MEPEGEPNMITNTRYIAYGKEGVFGPFVSEVTATIYAQDNLTNGNVRILHTPQPEQHTRPKALVA